jgi:acyl-CoA thioester hydrolase
MYIDIKIEPRYEETDQMGVIYHGNYFTYFEVARTGFFKHFGYPYKLMEERGVMLPVVDVNCQYKKPILYDDDIIIRTSIATVKGIRITLQYEIIRTTTDELLATGKTTHAFVDLDLKPIRYNALDPELKAIIDKSLQDE